MAIVTIQTLPEGSTKENIAAVSAAIMAGGNPAGALSHVIYEDGGRFKSVDVWESEAAYNSFIQDRLRPAIMQVAQSLGMDPSQMPAADPPQMFEAIENFPG